MGRAGRPSKLTEEVTARVVQALQGGNYRKVAAEWAGISSTVFREWMILGKKRPNSKHGEFRRRVLEAERTAEIRVVALVMKAAAEDPRHGEWWLARKFPERWADKTRIKGAVELSGPGGDQLVVEVRTLGGGDGGGEAGGAPPGAPDRAPEDQTGPDDEDGGP
jgi:transposase-like protein